MNINKKKIVALGLVSLGVMAAAGCVSNPVVDGKEMKTVEDITTYGTERFVDGKAIGFSDGENSVDITTDNQKAVDDYKATITVLGADQTAVETARYNTLVEYETLYLEQKATDAESGLAYFIDDIELTGNFADSFDADDFEKLATYEISYDDEEYDVTESVAISDAVATVLNREGFDGEVLVGVNNEGGIEYKIEFSNAIEINPVTEKKGLDIKFLGKGLNILEYNSESGDVTFKLFTRVKGNELNKVFSVDGKEITVVDTTDDHVRVKVGEEDEYLEVGETTEVGGLKIEVVDVDKEDTWTFYDLKVGTEITDKISDGDKYEPDDRFVWTVDGGEDGLKSLGIKLVETYEDDEDLLKVGDSISLPNDYLKFTLDGLENSATKEINLRATHSKIYVDTGCILEVDGNRVSDGKLVIYADGEGYAFDYEYKGEDYEGNTDFDSIVLLHGDRELGISVVDGQLVIFDEDKSYGFTFDFEEGKFVESFDDAEEMNDEDNYLIGNGDVLVKSEVNEEDATTSVKLLVVKEPATVTLRVH